MGRDVNWGLVLPVHGRSFMLDQNASLREPDLLRVVATIHGDVARRRRVLLRCRRFSANDLLIFCDEELGGRMMRRAKVKMKPEYVASRSCASTLLHGIKGKIADRTARPETVSDGRLSM